MTDFSRAGAGSTALALALLAPLAVLPSAYNPYNFPKLLVMALAITLGALAVRRAALPRIVLIIVAAGAVAFVVASLASAGPSAALLGRWPRYEGLPTLAIYFGAAWIGARLLGDPTPELIRSFRWWVSLSALVLGVLSVLDAAKVTPLGLTFAQRTGSLLGNATDQGLVGMMFAAVLLGPAIRRASPLLIAALGGSLLTVGLSGSRAAILGTGLVLVLHIARGRKANARALAGVGAVLGLLVVLLPQAWDRLLNGGTIKSRYLAWEETVAMVRDHPHFGAGPSGYTDAIGRYQDPEWVRVVGAAAKPDSPHSWPLQALSAGGYPLLIVALLLAYLIVRFGWRHVSDSAAAAQGTGTDRVGAQIVAEHYLGLLAAVGAYGTALLLNFTSPGPTSLAAFLTGALVALAKPKQEGSRGPAAVTALGGVLATVMAMACLSDVAMQSATELAAVGRVQLAKDRFEIAHRFRPFDADTHMLAAGSLAEQASRGNKVAAEAAAREARASLEVNPDSYESNTALGVALIAQGRLVEAMQVLDEAVVDYPFRGQAYIQRGIARIRLSDVSGGVLDLRRAITLRPNDPIPVRLLVELQARIDLAKEKAANARSTAKKIP